jgi:hypothetical protein
MYRTNSLLKLKAIDVIIFIIIYSSFFYLAGITKYSPIYFFYTFAFLLLSNYLFFAKIKISVDVILLFLTLISLLISSFINRTIFNGAVLNFVFGFLAYFILRAKREYSVGFIKRHIKKILIIILTTIIIDRFLIFLRPIDVPLEVYRAYEERNTLFYLYKGSYVFADSNSIGLILVMLLFFTLRVNNLLKINFKKLILTVTIILILLTFSRSAIIATIIGSMYFYLLILFKKTNKILAILFSTLLIILLSVFGYYVFINYIVSDLSFVSKIKIIEIVKNFLLINANFKNILWGIGTLNSLDMFGIYTHLFVFNVLIEGGLIFFIFYFLFFLYILLKYKFVKFYFFPVFINSFSAFFYFGFPLFFILISALINMEELNIIKER